MAQPTISLKMALLWSFIIVPIVARLSSPSARQEGADLTPIMFSDPILEPNIIATFPKGTWIENLAARSQDGNFLCTVLSAPEVYLLSSTSKFDPVLVAEFPGNLGVLGIAELGHDVFYAVVGNFSIATATSTPGSWSIWEIDLNHVTPDVKHHGTDSDWTKDRKARTRLVASLPDSGLLNGITVLNPSAGTLLVADSLYGAVWSVNVRNGDVAKTITDPTLAPQPDLSGGLAIGINGLSFRDDYLYYDNTNQVTFSRIPVNASTGVATGPAELLIDQEFANIFPDDFTLDAAGNAWLACEWGHIAYLEGVTAGARHNITAVAGNSTGLPHGLTAPRFGITAQDLQRGSLYVATNGGVFSDGEDRTTEGQLIRYDTAVLGFF